MAWESKLDNTVWTGKVTPYPSLWQTYGASGWHMELSNDLSGGQTYAEITALPGQFIKNYSKVRFGLRYTWYADIIIHYTAGADFQLYAEEETEYNLPTDRGYITGIEWTQLDRTFGSIGIDLQSLEFYYEEPPPSSEDYALAVDAPGQTFTSGGNSVCSIDTTVYHFGNSSVKSGSISDDGFSWLQTVVSGAGSGSFFWKVSSEQDYDFLKFYIDGIEQEAISGEVAWVKYDFAVSSGQHTLKWEYSKDGSASGGTDAGWIDLFTFTSSGFNPDTVRNEYIFQTVLSGDSADRDNWVSLFDNSVWTGNGYYIGALPSGALWVNSKWLIPVGTNKITPEVTPAGTDFDTFRPTKLKITYTGAESLDIILHHANGESYETADYVSGSDLFVFWGLYAITKIEFKRNDVYELYPYITSIEFYDADYIPTVIDDVILPVSNFSITHKIEYKDSEGEFLPFWDSASNPGDNGYSMAQSKYRITGTMTVPGYAYISDIADRMNNEIDIYVSIQTVNGEPDFVEFLTGLTLTKAVPSRGAGSVSVQLTFEKTLSFADVTWLYYVKEHGKHNFISPNGANGEHTINFPYFVSDMKPGYSLLLTGGDVQYKISEIQWIVSTSGITTYMKE